MKNPIVRELYTQEELQRKIEQHIARLKQSQAENDYRSVANVYCDIGCSYEILEDREKSTYYYEKVLDEWNTHHGEVPDYIYVSALRALDRPEEVLGVVLMHSYSWVLSLLADLHEETGRLPEAQLVYAGLSYCSYKLSGAC